MGHFAKKCRKPTKSQHQSSHSQQTNVNLIDTTSTKSDDEESVNYITSCQQLYDQVYDSNYDNDYDYYVAAISIDVANQLETLNAKIQYGKIFANSTIDSGSVCSIIKKTLATKFSKVHNVHDGSPQNGIKIQNII